MLELSEFVLALRSSVWVVFNNFLLIDALDRSKISSNQFWIQFDVDLYPFYVFANTPFMVNSFWFAEPRVGSKLENIFVSFSGGKVF